MHGQIVGIKLHNGPASLQLNSLRVVQQARVSRSAAPLKCVAIAYDERVSVVSPSNLAADGDTTEIPPKELLRRQKISMANKGRQPWNKGRHHSDEVKARISRATFLAMQRPDVRARMNEANLHRTPHSTEVKLKIQKSLKEHAGRCKGIITDQVDIIIAKLKASDDPEMQQMAELPETPMLIAKAAWTFWKRESDLYFIAERWDTVPEFQEKAKMKVAEVVERKERIERARQNTARRLASKGKVQSALETAKKLAHAKTKMYEAEMAVAKLQRLKKQLASDPEQYAAAVAAEQQATTMLQNLRAQVERLNKALAPLSKYLKLDTSTNETSSQAMAGRLGQ